MHNTKLEDSNCALIGSSLDLEARVKAAKTEKEWEGVGQTPGIQIWRIEKFNVVKWPKKLYGSFYNGDSYICLYTYKRGDKLQWNVHFWLGKETSQDEQGTAAYKTVELDDLLKCAPVQYREVQGYESSLFMSYFENSTITIMSGGIESGFNHVEPKKYIPKLFHIKGKRRVQVLEVEKSCSSLNLGDSFVLDAGLKLYSFLPKFSGVTERYRANTMTTKIKNKRKGCVVIELNENGEDRNGDVCSEFWELLGGKKKIKKETEVQVDELFDNLKKNGISQMYKIENKKKMEFSKVGKAGHLSTKLLDSNFVYTIDLQNEIVLWVGSKAPAKAKKEALNYAQSYLALNKKPNWLPISRVIEGRETKSFFQLFQEVTKEQRAETVDMKKKLGKTKTLKVKVISCSDLAKEDIFGKSDPYCQLQVENYIPQVTKVIKKTLNPVWNEEFKFNFMESEQEAILKVRVYDEDKLKKDDKLGKIDIPLSLIPHGTITRTFKLQKCKKGKITLQLTGTDFGVEEKNEEKNELFMPTLLFKLHSGDFYVEEKDCKVKLCSPYVKFSLGNQKCKSSIVEKINKPIWTNERFILKLDDVKPEEDVLRIRVKHHNPLLVKKELIGEIHLPVGAIPYDKVVTRNLPLIKGEKILSCSLKMSFKCVDFGKLSCKKFY